MLDGKHVPPFALLPRTVISVTLQGQLYSNRSQLRLVFFFKILQGVRNDFLKEHLQIASSSAFRQMKLKAWS